MKIKSSNGLMNEFRAFKFAERMQQSSGKDINVKTKLKKFRVEFSIRNLESDIFWRCPETDKTMEASEQMCSVSSRLSNPGD